MHLFVLLLKKNSMKHYLNEALRIDKNNLKTLYRIAFCYFNLEKFDDSKNTIKKALDICKENNNQKDSVLFVNLDKDINNKIKEYQNNEDNLYKKIMGKN